MEKTSTRAVRKNGWNQTRLRLTIAGLWLAFWVLSSCAVMLQPVLRRVPALEAPQILSLLTQVASVWLPPMSCLVGFWFTSHPPRTEREKRISTEKAAAAIVLTTTYLSFVLLVILYPLYLAEYPNDTFELPAGGTPEELMTSSVKYALLLSPLALAPINWLTGTPTEEKDNAAANSTV